MTQVANSDGGSSAIDWERIEGDYRAGVKTLREIANERGVSHTAIRKRAERLGWTRDLEAKIRAKADALVSKHVVSSTVSMETAATELEVVDANAKAIANVKLAHRTDIGRGRVLCMQLLAELEAVTHERDLIEQRKHALASGDPDAAALISAAVDRVTSIPGRAGTLKSLTDSLKSLVALERVAWGIAEATEGAGGWEGMLVEIAVVA